MVSEAAFGGLFVCPASVLLFQNVSWLAAPSCILYQAHQALEATGQGALSSKALGSLESWANRLARSTFSVCRFVSLANGLSWFVGYGANQRKRSASLLIRLPPALIHFSGSSGSVRAVWVAAWWPGMWCRWTC